MGAEARDAPGAVGRHLVAFVDEALIPQPLEHPPRGLYVRVVVGDVSVLHVQPHASALGHGLPLADVAEDALAAAAVELLDPERLNLLLAGDAELLLDLQFHGQAVRVPSAPAQGPEAAHGLVAQDDVLERAREHVVDAGAAVRRRRPFVEDEQGRIRAGALDLVRQISLSPRFEDRRLQLWEVHLAGDGFVPFPVACHASPSKKKTPDRTSADGRCRGTTTIPPRSAQGHSGPSRRARMRAEGCRCNGRTARPRLLAPLAERSGGGSGGMFGRSCAPACTVPGSLCARWPAYSSPSQPVG